MSRTNRIWHKPQFRFRMKLEEGCKCPICGLRHGNYYVAPWTLDSMAVFRRKKTKRMCKEIRHTIRCRNRGRFSQGIYESYDHTKIDYFD